jgi:hypothetical protein
MDASGDMVCFSEAAFKFPCVSDAGEMFLNAPALVVW